MDDFVKWMAEGLTAVLLVPGFSALRHQGHLYQCQVTSVQNAT